MIQWLKALKTSVNGSEPASPAPPVSSTIPNEPPTMPSPPAPAIGLAPAFERGFGYGMRYLPQTSNAPSLVEAGTLPANPLEAYFDAQLEGPGIWKWRHYFETYHRHFAKFVGREVHVLEIGVYSGGGLGLWKHYFGDGCRLYGVDILPACKAFEGESVQIFLGDQADREFWKRFKAEVPIIDIVIDDGGHQPDQQMISLEELLPHVRSGGVYLCEDVYGARHDFHAHVAGLSDQLNALGPARPGVADFHDGMTTNPVQRDLHSVHFYPHITVVEKNTVPVSEFSAPRRGDQWLKWP